MLRKRLETYFEESHKHIELIEESLSVLEPVRPIRDYDSLGQLERFALNALIFRFSKLQDLLGAKVFRNYLDYSGFQTHGKSFFQILREIEREGIVDIDTWNMLRELRNQIAHEYPEDLDETLESIELLLQKSPELIALSKNMERKYREIEPPRDLHHQNDH
jgi:hypothetical protein